MTSKDQDFNDHETFEDDGGVRQRIDKIVPEILKRTFYAGLGAVFTTEEGIRKLAHEFSLPKDAANYLIQQAQGTKSELFRIVAAELRSFLESLNLNEELTRLLTSISFEIKTEIRFIPNDAKLAKPKVSSKVKMKRKKPEPQEEEVVLVDEFAEEPAEEEPVSVEPEDKASDEDQAAPQKKTKNREQKTEDRE